MNCPFCKSLNTEKHSDGDTHCINCGGLFNEKKIMEKRLKEQEEAVFGKKVKK